MIEIKIAETENDKAFSGEAMFLLRPMLQIEKFVEQINKMKKERYQLLFLTENGVIVSVAGYRIFSMLYCGKQLYIDDLSTLES